MINILTDAQQFKRVRLCEENLAKFHQETCLLCDEWRFYYKQTWRKSPNAAWIPTPPTVVRRSRFASSIRFCIVFKTIGPVLIHHIDREDTIDHRYYCLEVLIEEIHKQRSTSCRHARKLHHDNAGAHMHKDVVDYLEPKGIHMMRSQSVRGNSIKRFGKKCSR